MVVILLCLSCAGHSDKCSKDMNCRNCVMSAFLYVFDGLFFSSFCYGSLFVLRLFDCSFVCVCISLVINWRPSA